MNAIKESPTVRARCHLGQKTIKYDEPNGTGQKEIDVKASTTYKPEYSWNYEVGSHLTLWEGKTLGRPCSFLYGYP